MVKDRAEIRQMLLRSRNAADGHIQTIRRAVPLSYALFRQEMRQFVLDKYLLTEADVPADDGFDELTERSLARSMKISPELVKEFDTAQSCDGATSAMAKKVLLFMAMEKALQIRMPARESARLTTLEELIQLLWSAMKTTPVWVDRLA